MKRISIILLSSGFFVAACDSSDEPEVPMSNEERALFEQALSEDVQPAQFGSEDDLALALEMLHEAEGEAVDEDELEELAAVREEIEATASADPPNAAFEAASDAVGAPANCQNAASMAKSAGAFAGIAETYANLNWQSSSGRYRIDCFLKAIMMDSKLDIAAESMKTAGTGIGAWSQAFSDLNVGLSYADEAVYMCAASQYGTPTTYGNLAFGYSQVARDWGNLAKEQLGQCLPFF